jgi:hypothetical protein
LPLSRFRRVVIFCPLAVTGGPEAIHQLAQSLNAIGVDCWLVHVGRGQKVVIRADCIETTAPDADHARVYSAYGPRFRNVIPLGPETLAILPEGLTRHHSALRGCGVAIWWLSVDNAYRQFEMDGLDPETQLAAITANRELIHLYQSAYARDWLRGLGLEQIFDVGDYTSPLFTAAPAKSPPPRPLVSYNGSKGAALAQAFFAEAPQFEGLALRDFSKPQLAQIFRERLLYVDFGHFPGKDRLPREAAASGGVVFIHRKGAGASYEDFPLPDFFKFDEADVTSGSLRARLEAVAADPQAHWTRQAHFRSVVAWEKAQFHDQVMRLWGVRRMV